MSRKIILVVLGVVSVAGVVSFLAMCNGSKDAAVDPAQPTKSHATHESGGYWTEDRMKSATPAPMPTK